MPSVLFTIIICYGVLHVQSLLQVHWGTCSIVMSSHVNMRDMVSMSACRKMVLFCSTAT